LAYLERLCSVEFGIIPLNTTLLRGQREKCRDGEKLGPCIGRHWSLTILHSPCPKIMYEQKLLMNVQTTQIID